MTPLGVGDGVAQQVADHYRYDLFGRRQDQVAARVDLDFHRAALGKRPGTLQFLRNYVIDIHRLGRQPRLGLARQQQEGGRELLHVAGGTLDSCHGAL